MRVHLGVAAVFIAAIAVSSCGGSSDDMQHAQGSGSFTVTMTGSGEASSESLWPLRVGSQFRFDAATWFISRDFDLEGTRTFVLQSAIRTPGVLPLTLGENVGEFGPAETWLTETADGVVLLATSPKDRTFPILIAPAQVRDGMHWQVSGDGIVIAEGQATGGVEEDTIYGRRRTWHITLTATTSAGRTINATFAEGRGLVSVEAVATNGGGQVAVTSAIVPLTETPAPTPLTFTAMTPLFGGEPVTGAMDEVGALHTSCAGFGYQTGTRQIGISQYPYFGAGGHYVSAVEDASGEFDIRLGGATLQCDNYSAGLAMWIGQSWVWSLKTAENDVIPLNDAMTLPPSYGYEAPAAQDARTSAWAADGTMLRWSPASQSGARQGGLWVNLAESGFEANFAHSSAGAFLDETGHVLSVAPSDGVHVLPDSLPTNEEWYYAQQPTASLAATAFMDPLPVGDYPMVIADANFVMGAGSTDYLVSAFGRLSSGRIEYLPDAPQFQRFTLSGLREGPLSVDPLTTILRHGNTRETFLFEHHVGVWKLEHTEHGLRRRLLARPEIPAGHRVVGAFQSGDRVLIATQSGDIFVSGDLASAIATAGVYFWSVPLDAASDAEAFPEVLELNLAADGQDLRVEWSPDAQTPPSAEGWTLADVPVRAFPVTITRAVGDEPAIATPRHALLLNRRNMNEVAPELSLPEGLDDPTPAPFPLLFPGENELGAYRAEGDIPGVGRVLFTGRVAPTELSTGPGYPDPPVLDTGVDLDGDGHVDNEPTVRDSSGSGTWTVGALTTATGSCSASACLPVSYFEDRVGSSATHPAAYSPIVRTILVPAEGETRLTIALSPAEGGVVVVGTTTGASHLVAVDGTVTELHFPLANPSLTWVGGPSVTASVPGALSLCRTDRNEVTHTASVTCTDSEGVERVSPTLVEPILNYAALSVDDVRWPGVDTDHAPYLARSARSYIYCNSLGCPTTGNGAAEFRAERLDLATMRFRAQSGAISYHRTHTGDLFAITSLYAATATAWRLFHVTDQGFVFVVGGVNPTSGGMTPVMDSDETFLKVMLAGGCLRVPHDEANALTATCDYNAYSSRAGCVCEAGFEGDGTTCTPVLGSLARPASSCGEWIAAGQPALGAHNPVVDPDGAGPRAPYVNLCAVEGDHYVTWPFTANESGVYVKLNRDTFEPLECASALPASGSPEYYNNRFVAAFTDVTDLAGEFSISFTLSHAVRRAGIDVDLVDGFDPTTIAYTSLSSVCSGDSAPRLHHLAVVGDSTYPESMRAYRAIYGTSSGDVEVDLPPEMQIEALAGTPFVLARDAAGTVTLTAGAASYTFPGTHVGAMRLVSESRNGLDTDTSFATVNITRIAQPVP